MTQSKSNTPTIAGMVRQMQELAGFNPLATPLNGTQVEHFWEAQDNILRDAEAFARNWFERRHTATRTAIDASRQATGSGVSDPGAAVRAIADWKVHSMERIAEDFGEWFDLWSNCAAHLSRAEAEAGEAALEKTAKTAGKVMTGKAKTSATSVLAHAHHRARRPGRGPGIAGDRRGSVQASSKDCSTRI